MKLKAILLRRYDDVPHALAYGDERSGLDIVEAAVGHEVLDVLPRHRKALDLVEDDDRLTYRHVLDVLELQHTQERVNVLALVAK